MKPELTVLSRRSISLSKTVKRLRRFLEKNPADDYTKTSPEDDEAIDELRVRVPDDKLNQLRQIFNGITSGPALGALTRPFDGVQVPSLAQLSAESSRPAQITASSALNGKGKKRRRSEPAAGAGAVEAPVKSTNGEAEAQKSGKRHVKGALVEDTGGGSSSKRSSGIKVGGTSDEPKLKVRSLAQQAGESPRPGETIATAALNGKGKKRRRSDPATETAVAEAEAPVKSTNAVAKGGPIEDAGAGGSSKRSSSVKVGGYNGKPKAVAVVPAGGTTQAAAPAAAAAAAAGSKRMSATQRQRKLS